ncbi:NADP-dependent oxidoreductase domain-containing protein [Neurospora hispaniola]|uniref:NADP-dependent oxidoreductase domain-containing protein n=1 Tax=Neurospora hispaniola TaxID=588809 RepID=A0AAJ0I5U4_9PEZI|nr:NADP-dependent oxidoreductase domain-containing protein [Neurospora hispaniola]
MALRLKRGQSLCCFQPVPQVRAFANTSSASTKLLPLLPYRLIVRPSPNRPAHAHARGLLLHPRQTNTNGIPCYHCSLNNKITTQGCEAWSTSGAAFSSIATRQLRGTRSTTTMASADASINSPAGSDPLHPKVNMPRMIYGTAWKKNRTADLVYQAIKEGFRGIDTAAMKRHYSEELTGEGIRRAIRDGIVTREELFIQTKYTPHDDAFLAEPALYPTITSQVLASVTSSLRNLAHADSPESQEDTSYIDCLIMHSPFPDPVSTLEAWTALQSFVPHRIRSLGISNITLPELQYLVADPRVTVYPTVIQNRFRRAERRWDYELRRWCANQNSTRWKGEKRTRYQGFWTLTGNRGDWPTQKFVRELAAAVPKTTQEVEALEAEGAAAAAAAAVAEEQREGEQDGGKGNLVTGEPAGPGDLESGDGELGISLEAAWYALTILGADVVVLNGTTSQQHMRDDLDCLERVDRWRKTPQGEKMWDRCFEEFKALVGMPPS